MIQCVCLNPVLQRTLTLERFTVNTVNRALGRPLEGSAGKGINAARALKTLGQQAIITGFCGGDTGKLIERTLEEEGLRHEFVRTVNKTRICTTILDTSHNTQTEIVEEGLPVSQAEVTAMAELYRKHLRSCRLVTISGTAPQHVPKTLYKDFVSQAAEQHVPTLIDTQKELLRECLGVHPLLIKINREELCAAFGERSGSEERFAALIQRVLKEGGQWVVVTDGPKPSIVAHQADMWEIFPPDIRAVNPIGAGDVALGGIAAALARGEDVLQAIQFGTACGSASTLTMTPGVIRIDDVERLASEIQILRKI